MIAIDEYKGDTREGKYQLIIEDGIMKKPLDILPNRYKNTIKHYLLKHGSQVQVVIMDISQSFKAAVQSPFTGHLMELEEVLKTCFIPMTVKNVNE